jgi:hypothetical protein
VSHDCRAFFATLPLAAAALSIISSENGRAAQYEVLEILGFPDLSEHTLGGHETNAGLLELHAVVPLGQGKCAYNNVRINAFP